ncbi:MAG: peptidylprolyl isomerase [candidate division WOR-3 bacterium]
MRALTAFAVLLLLLGCGGQKPVQPAKTAPEPAAKAPETTATLTEPAPESSGAEQAAATEVKGMLKDQLDANKLPDNLFITIKVKDYGTMKVKFYTKEAPKNVANVANLAIKGFYNGLTFHRIIPGFVVQGGDPKGDGTGGPGYTVPAEIKMQHTKGAMAMARIGDQYNPKRESSGSQFYLCLAPLPQLDAGGYTVIGQLVEGMDVLERLGQVKTGAMDRPITPVVMEQVYVTTR